MSQAGSLGNGSFDSTIQTIDGDTGSITGSTVTIYADQAEANAGKTVAFVNSGTTSTLNVSSNNNTLIGYSAGYNATLTGGGNTGLGDSCLYNLTSGYANVGIGHTSLYSLTSGHSNAALSNNLGNLISGNLNTAIGIDAGINLATGSGNIFVGMNAGSHYMSSESNNILINNVGTIGESNVMRLGISGSGSQQVNKTFLAGVTGVTAVGSPVAVSSTGQLSDLGFGTATQVLTSNGAGVSPTWQAAGGGGTNSTFISYLSGNVSNVTGDNTLYTIPFDTTLVNQGTVFNTSTGEFTAPNTGNYSFSFNMLTSTVGTFNSSNWFLYVNGVQNLEFFGASLPSTASFSSVYATGVLNLTAGDVVTCVYSADTAGNVKNVGIFGGSTIIRFSGFQIS